MKGIILAGDSGSRLYPLTLGIPKQLLPIYDKPMIFYPLQTLIDAGIHDILIITTDEHLPLFEKALSTFRDANISFATQSTPNGIAEAITIGRDFIADDTVCLITGDTIIAGSELIPQIQKATRAVEKSGNATIFVQQDNDPNQYGRVILNRDGKIETIVGENTGSSSYSITGLYIFPNKVVTIVNDIQRSERGLLEITDVNRLFFEQCKLQVQTLDSRCTWFDTNTFDNLLRCSQFIQRI